MKNQKELFERFEAIDRQEIKHKPIKCKPRGYRRKEATKFACGLC